MKIRPNWADFLFKVKFKLKKFAFKAGDFWV